MQKVIYVMGVSGCGKTTIGKLIAAYYNIPFYDGDDFHPLENVKKMASGTPLEDSDRTGWLEAIHSKAYNLLEKTSLVIACSALKEKYRNILTADIVDRSIWIYLHGTYEEIGKRMAERKNHYMPPHLLRSQFNDLEEPKNAIFINVQKTPEQILISVLEKLELKREQYMKLEFGLIGLGVMGKSLSRNLARKGTKLSLYNRFVAGKEENVAVNFVNEFPELSHAHGYEDLPQFVKSLTTPRKIFLMVNAGQAVDDMIGLLVPLLDKGDVIIDGGNSNYKETERRNECLQEKEIEFIGTGVSGGERGALEGPSIMPGGSFSAYNKIKDHLEKIAAKDSDGKACCAYIGKGGAGHFVKMVHNGIEYAEMQLIAEVYAYMRFISGKKPSEISKIFNEWNQGELRSYLLEITVEILLKQEGDQYLIDLILDKAGNKGTGSWTTIAACELGVPIPSITAALYARYQSYFKKERDAFQEKLPFNQNDKKVLSVGKLSKLYETARILNHYQGFHLIQAASDKYKWDIYFSDLARIWTNGCIIRSELMQKISHWSAHSPNFLVEKEALEPIVKNIDEVLESYGSIAESGIASPCISASMEYIKGLKSPFPTANIIQAQRDFFGAHTYERIDDDSGKKHHTSWEA